MSWTDRAGGVDHLRSVIARIEAGEGVSQAARAPPRVRFTDAAPLALDSALGPLTGGALYDVVPAQAGDGATASGFALALALRFSAAEPHRRIVWITEDFAGRETGLPYGPGLQAFGAALERLILVRAPQGPQLLWAMEEALKCRALGAVIGEIWSGARHYDLTASRRLALAARAGGAPGLILHAGAPGRGRNVSAAPLRFEVSALPARKPLILRSGLLGPRLEGRGASPQRRPLPGPPAFAVRILRARGARSIDADRIFPLIWNSDERHFLDADSAALPHPLAVPADAGERPGPALARRSA